MTEVSRKGEREPLSDDINQLITTPPSRRSENTPRKVAEEVKRRGRSSLALERMREEGDPPTIHYIINLLLLLHLCKQGGIQIPERAGERGGGGKGRRGQTLFCAPYYNGCAAQIWNKEG